MTIALYCPMKPPDHPLASGDREIGRLIAIALERLGKPSVIASHLVTWQATPNPDTFARLARASDAEAERLIEAWSSGADRPEAWVTYHLYHKAPDWIGPKVTGTLDLPYAVIEASRARKRATDPWAAGFAAAEIALRAADAVASMHDEDRQGLADIVTPERLVSLAPFIDAQPFAELPRRPPRPNGPVHLLAVGMMRPGNKAACYRVLADALAKLADLPWHLTIAGDGEASSEIRPLFDPARTTFLGCVDRPTLLDAYRDADIFVWPAVNEPFGLVFLEAQAAALPVVGGRSRGVPEIVADGETGLLVPQNDPDAFANALATLIRTPERRATFGAAGRTRVLARHDLVPATAAIGRLLETSRINHDARRRQR
ncbi:glycosyltransferase family 4 protein [Amorphus sp. 3PC139-8]|uniref:glycosyltransferase family 4 protein n=1 Tax=Amorphus sp. 3PC139-8 TaxID=2735676 RepID=UPI00345CCBA6